MIRTLTDLRVVALLTFTLYGHDERIRRPSSCLLESNGDDEQGYGLQHR
jgi:hypothetical protein